MNLIDPSDSRYQSYLLRFWRESDGQRWHAILQSTATKQTYHFADVEALIAFLLVELGPKHTSRTDAGAGKDTPKH